MWKFCHTCLLEATKSLPLRWYHLVYSLMGWNPFSCATLLNNCTCFGGIVFMSHHAPSAIRLAHFPPSIGSLPWLFEGSVEKAPTSNILSLPTIPHKCCNTPHNNQSPFITRSSSTRKIRSSSRRMLGAHFAPCCWVVFVRLLRQEEHLPLFLSSFLCSYTS